MPTTVTRQCDSKTCKGASRQQTVETNQDNYTVTYTCPVCDAVTTVPYGK